MEEDNSLYFKHYPGYFSSDLFETLYEELKDKALPYTNTFYGKEYPSKRASCFFRSLEPSSEDDPVSPKAKAAYFSYDDLQSFDWSDAPILNGLKEKIETEFETHYDYCLVHIYRNGKDTIAWHNDKEALNTDVLSVSFGAKRIFRMRRMGKKYEKGEVEAEFELGSGDVFHMLEGCQRKFIHTVPTQSSIKTPRINLTFRKFDT